MKNTIQLIIDLDGIIHYHGSGKCCRLIRCNKCDDYNMHTQGSYWGLITICEICDINEWSIKDTNNHE